MVSRSLIFAIASSQFFSALAAPKAFARDESLRCGTTWEDANGKCGTPCPNAVDSDCPSGQHCYNQLDTSVCNGGGSSGGSGGGATGGSIRCGSSWEDANGKCGTSCPNGTDDECSNGEKCFNDLDTSVCGNVPVPQTSDGGSSGGSGGGSGNVLISGSGQGSYYYDWTGRTCNGDAPYAENNGYTFCEPDAPPYETLGQHENNYIVALAVDQMQANKAGLCGKKVNVYHNGQQVSGNFVVWDACAACSGGVRLDFSVTALNEIDSNACQEGLVSGISWEVVDEQVIPYVP